MFKGTVDCRDMGETNMSSYKAIIFAQVKVKEFLGFTSEQYRTGSKWIVSAKKIS